jgi:hypothetical protein
MVKYKVKKIVERGVVKWIKIPVEDPPAVKEAEIKEDKDAEIEERNREIKRLEAIVVRLSRELDEAKSRSGDYIISDQPFRKSEPESSDVIDEAVGLIESYDCYN